ncbi:MAG: hypothetical protein ACOVQ4_14060 [Flectobacillus sp.]
MKRKNSKSIINIFLKKHKGYSKYTNVNYYNQSFFKDWHYPENDIWDTY